MAARNKLSPRIAPASLIAILSAAVVGVLPALPGVSSERARADGGVVVKIVSATPASQPAGQTGAGAGQSKDNQKPPEQKIHLADHPDLHKTITNLPLSRDLDKLAKPKPPALWEKLVNQPYYTPAVRARKLLFFGQYSDAEIQFGDLLKAHPDNQQYIEGYLDAVLQQAHTEDIKRFEDKVATLTDAQRDTAKVTRLRAQCMASQGKTEEAIELLKKFADAHPKLDPADPELLSLYDDYGRTLEGAAEYGAAIGIYAQVEAVGVGGLPPDPEAATDIAIATWRKGVLTATGRDKYKAVLSELSQIEENDQTYWPAKIVEAKILLNSHNDKDTAEVLANIAQFNPNQIETAFLGIDHAIAGYDFEAARAQLEALKARTDGALVDAYEGRLILKERLLQQALPSLLAAIKKNPELPQARGWLAGAYYLLNDPAKMNEQLHAIKTPPGISIHPVVLFEAAEILRDDRQFAEAEKLYKEAENAAKWWAEPPAALAELYLETGEEKKAREAYDQSFAIDPYNRRAYNQLTLLDILGKFSTLESKERLRPGSDEPAFIIRYDPQDQVLATLAMQWMEKVRPEIWSYFQVTDLPCPTTIEFFPSHEEFGVRTTGLPWIGTVGACTGPVIAMDVPRGGAKDLMGAFDWARVLRHEYTHTVTLAMTNNRIPHWLTEACACEQEQAPRDWETCQFLDLQLRTGELFPIADLNWGFIKPKRSVDRQLAYGEAQWLYEYLVGKYGLPKMLDFIRAFGDGLTEPEAWKKVYNTTEPDMDKEFQAWAVTQLASWGLPTDMLPKLPDLLKAIQKDPKDVDSLVKLAYVLAGSGNRKAKDYAEQALKIDDKNVEARELLGAMLSQSKNPADLDKATTLLEGVLKDHPKRPVSIRSLAVIAMQRAAAKPEDQRRPDFDAAEKGFLELQAMRPLDESSYTNLAGIYLVEKDYPKAIAQLLELQRHEQHDERIPRTLAELFQKEGNLPEAQQSAFRAIRINPYDAVNHELLAQILVAEKEPRKSIEYWADAAELQPKVGEFWEGLADARGDTGDAAGAAAAAKKALALNPNSPAAKWAKE